MNEHEKKAADSKIESIRNKVSAKIQESKHFIVCYLNEKVNNLSATHKRVSLIIFGVIMLAVCSSMIITSINDATDSISIDRITLPKDIYPNDEYRKGFRKILRIKTLLDSLRRSPSRITVYDSLMNARPGLMDSLHSLVKSYQMDYSH